ncbi:MAG: exonuclease SbcCD subunit D [Actinomycetota bacterium]
MGVRFVHSADWQLGMRRRLLDGEAQARFAAARIEAIATLGELAAAEGAELILVSGDVFESNQVDRRTVCRALEMMKTAPVPIYLLPGNHDPLEPGSVYLSPTFVAAKPENVHVLDGCTPVEVRAGVELVGAPWRSKRPLCDLVVSACDGLAAAPTGIRICVAHGIVDRLSPDRDNPALLSAAALHRLVDDGIVHYIALGDRHSATSVGDSRRIWYSGSPEPTDHDEVSSGRALVVDLDRDACRVDEHVVGTWRFVRESFTLRDEADVGRVERWLADVPDKPRAVAKLTLVGELSLRATARLDQVLDAARDLFAAVGVAAAVSDLVVLPDELDLDALQLSGFAHSAADQLFARSAAGPDQAATDALTLLYRLSAGAP